MIFAGVDPSLTATGICILNIADRTKPNLVPTIMHVSTISSKLHGIRRVIEIADRIQSLLINSQVGFTCIEGYGFGCRGAAVFSLAELGGVIRERFVLNNLQYYDIPPMTLKKFVCGKGNAQKDKMLEQTYRKWNIGSETLTDNNQVDAYGLARFGLAYYHWSNGHREFKDYELESFKKVHEA